MKLKNQKINKIIVSTDSKKYAKICEDFGIEVPLLGPNLYQRMIHHLIK